LAYVVVTLHGKEIQRRKLEGTISFGRSLEADVTLEDGAASRMTSRTVLSFASPLSASIQGMKDSPAFYQSLVLDRNRRWIPRIESCLATGSCFVVVGAAHMVGSDGLIAMLRQKGYKITQQ